MLFHRGHSYVPDRTPPLILILEARMKKVVEILQVRFQTPFLPNIKIGGRGEGSAMDVNHLFHSTPLWNQVFMKTNFNCQMYFSFISPRYGPRSMITGVDTLVNKWQATPPPNVQCDTPCDSDVSIQRFRF